MISLKHENGRGSNAWDGELHNFGWLDDFYEKEKTVECEFNIFLWKPVLFWPQTILYLQIHYLAGMFSGQGWLKDGSRSRWNVTSLYYPLECTILVLSSIPCPLFFGAGNIWVWTRDNNGRVGQMPHIAPKYQGTQLPKHSTKNACAPNIQYKSWRL